MQNIKVVSFAESPIDGLLLRINPRVEMIVQRDQLPPHVMAKYQKYLAISSLDGIVESLGDEVDRHYLRNDLSWDVPPGMAADVPVDTEAHGSPISAAVEDVSESPSKEAPKAETSDEGVVCVTSNEDGKAVTSEVKANDLAFVDAIEPAKPTSETPEFYKKSENRKNKKRN